MTSSQMNRAVRRLCRSVLTGDGAGLTDGQLLTCYIEQRDEAAFAALVRRHGPMVLGVCRRTLRSPHDADDAFQATFLVLVRKAASVKPREAVANWLYGVARMTALRAKVAAAKRRARERQVPDMPEREAPPPGLWDRLQPLLDEELSRLPEKYRIPVVLCDLEGRTHKEAARQLGWPQGTVSGRLARARVLLAKRLTRLGLALSGGALAAVLAEQAASACPPPPLASSTLQAAAVLAAGQAATGVVPAEVAALVQGVLKDMLLTKLKIVSAALLVAAAACGAVGLAARPATGGQADPAGGVTPQDGQEQLRGRWVLVAREQEGRRQEYPQGAGVTLDFSEHELRFVARPINPLGPSWDATTSVHAYRVEPGRKPKGIDLIDAKDQAFLRGIYTMEGETLRICWGDAGSEGRPTELTAKPGSGRTLGVFRRDDARPNVTGQWKDRLTDDATGEQMRDTAGAGPPRKNARNTDLEQLQGVWAAVSGERYGEELSGAALKAEVSELAFLGGTVRWRKEGGGETWMQFSINPNTTPKEMDLDRTRKGIYELDRDSLKLCIHRPWRGSGDRDYPTKMAGTGPDRLLVVFARREGAKKAGEAGAAAHARPAAETPAEAGAEAPQGAWANKLFDEAGKDFGTCGRGEQLTHRFRMRNIYAVPLDITQVRASCGCVACSPSQHTLQPGETGYLEVTMDSARFSGAKTVKVCVTVGPEYASTAVLTVTAKSLPDEE
jgi:RNA polymerase sigma factor (sigma-70 family)